MGERDRQTIYLNEQEYRTLSPQGQKKYVQGMVDVCARMGGGRVVVPAGRWFSGPIHLRSRIELHLCEGSVIEFSDVPEDYLPVVFTRWEGIECYNYSPLIYARDCEHISITGTGLLVGNGRSWWGWKKTQQNAANELCYAERNGIAVEKRCFGTREAALRPSFVQMLHCRNVVLRDFTILDGPQWTIHPVYCENVLVKGVTVHTTGPNTDGLNPDSCRNVWIEKCTLETGDDCIAVNSGMNEDGWRVNRPCKGIYIVDCDMNAGHGAIVVGSGMSGGVENVYAENCRIRNTMQGIRIKSMRGRGGYIKNVLFQNIRIDAVSEEAIQISMFYPYSTVAPLNGVPPVFDGITIRNISGSAAKQAKVIRGLEDSPITNLVLETIKVSHVEEDIVVCADLTDDGQVRNGDRARQQP